MRNLKTIIILTFFYSCSPISENQSIEKRLIGQWKTESCLPYFVHANIRVAMADTSEILKYRIKPSFFISFKQNNLFSFENENGSTKTGNYELFDNLLSLKLNNDSEKKWIIFKVDSVTDNKLFLTSKSIRFYSNTADSAEVFTGDNVVLILKRK